RVGGVSPASYAAEANSAATGARPSTRTSFESSAAIETVASGFVTGCGGCCVSPATRSASAPRVSGSCGRKVAMSGPISSAATTARMSAAAQELAPDTAGAVAVPGAGFAGFAGGEGVVGVDAEPGGCGGTLAVAVATATGAQEDAARTRTGGGGL